MTYKVLTSLTAWVGMVHPTIPEYVIGIGRELTTGLDNEQGNIFEFEGRRADLVHRHAEAFEIYWVQHDSCPVEFWLDGERVWVEPGGRLIIEPGTWHASRPAENDVRNSHIIVVATPAFSEDDQEFMAEQPDGWLDL